MGNVVIATLEIPFVDPDLVGADGFRLQLFLEEGIIIGNDRFLRLYPAVPALLRASVGDIIRLGDHGQLIEKEAVEFQGSSTASTRFPIAQLLTVTQFGAIFDRDGNTVNTSFTAVNGQLQAERDVYGAITVDYNTTYSRLQYKPEVTGDVNTAITINLGTVLAFFNGSVATFTIQPSAFPDIENFELYALESKTVVQGVQVYEFPPGWPNDNTFPGRVVPPDNLPDPDDAWVLVRRFHEIGYITPSRSFTSREFFVRNEVPFVGNFTFDPVISLTVSSEVPDELLNSQQAQTALANAQEKVTA
jgi:hypothetical protein